MKQTKPRKAMALRFAMVLWTLVRVALAILLVIWCVLHLKALDRYSDFKLPYVGRIPGMIMIAIGGGLVMWCAVILSGAGILDNRADKLFPLELKATGPFRCVRNPMSLGATVLLLGVGLWMRSIAVLLFSVILFLVLHLVVVCVEEPGLEKRFGASYLNYKRAVGRWMPRIGKSKFEE